MFFIILVQQRPKVSPRDHNDHQPVKILKWWTQKTLKRLKTPDGSSFELITPKLF